MVTNIEVFEDKLKMLSCKMEVFHAQEKEQERSTEHVNKAVETFEDTIHRVP